MKALKVETRENVSILRFDNGVTNAITMDMLHDFSVSLKEIKDQNTDTNHGVVLVGNSKFFSMGFDLPALVKEDRKGMSGFFYKFNEIVLELYTLPFPTIAAVSGHAAAGGCIFALGCDFRFADPKKKMGLNELLLGLPAPYLVDMILRQVTNDRVATTLLYQGDFIKASEAQASGLIDKLFLPDDVEKNAIEKAANLASTPGPAFAAIKANRVEGIRALYEKNYKEKNEIFLDCWFSKPVQALLMEAAQKF